VGEAAEGTWMGRLSHITRIHGVQEKRDRKSNGSSEGKIRLCLGWSRVECGSRADEFTDASDESINCTYDTTTEWNDDSKYGSDSLISYGYN